MAERQVIIGRQFSFDCAHELPNHNGKCRNLHGHTYNLEVEYRGPIVSTLGLSDSGMVVDFGAVKENINRLIIDRLDHKYLNDEIPFRPTCENLVRFIFRLLQGAPNGSKLWKVRLWESPESWAEVTKDDVEGQDYDPERP